MSMTKIAALAASSALVASPRVRGIIAARAEPNLAETLAELNRTFAAFREKNDQRMAEIERGREDVVTNEHVDRINASVSELTATVEALQARVAASAVGGRQQSPEAREYGAAFNTWFRRGEAEAGLRDLAVKAALSSDNNPSGGFVVPEEMDSTISRVLSTVSAVRGIARVVTMNSAEYSTLVSQGGANGGWVAERDSRSSTTTPTLAQIDVPGMELYANPGITQTLLDDASLNIEQWLADEVAITFAEMEGEAFVSGDGVKRPRGFLSYGTVANASYAWGSIGFVKTGAAADFATSNPIDNVMDLFGALRPGYRNNGTFVSNDATITAMRKFKDSTGNLIWAPPTVDNPQTILGKPVVTDENMPSVGANAFPLAFGDFQRGYLIADRIGTRVLRDPFTNKPYVQFYTTKRVGGGVANFEAIKLLKCST